MLHVRVYINQKTADGKSFKGSLATFTHYVTLPCQNQHNNIQNPDVHLHNIYILILLRKKIIHVLYIS